MLNKIILMGRCASDPEKRMTQSGVPVTSVTLAVDRDFKDKDGNKETDWISVIAFRETANFLANYFTKGRMAVVSGRLQVRKWKNKEGENRYTTEVVAENVYFGDSKKETSGGESYGGNYGQVSGGYPATGSDFAPIEDEDTELPF